MLPTPTCAILYGSNPIKFRHTTGVVACAGTSQNPTVFTRQDLLDLNIELRDYSEGISYVRVGSQASITLYTAHDPASSLHSLVVDSGINLDLTKVTVKEETGDSVLLWDDRTISFAIGSG